MFYRHKILSQSELKKLSEHKYSVTSASILEPYLQPFWNSLVDKLPLWLAPNLITILGLFCNVLTALILIYYNPDAKDNYHPPRWSYLLCGIGLFLYQTLDAIDGKQARRTGSANSMGELFDHGCDSISTVFVALSTCVSAQFGTHPRIMFIEVFAVLALFYCAHWQAYVSGTLHFGKFDVTEAHYLVIAINVVTFFIGPEIWTQKIFGRVEPWIIIIVLTIFTGFLVINDFIATIRKGGSGKNGSTVAGTSILSPILPFMFIFVPAYVIAIKSKSGIYETHPILYMMMFGLLFAKITNKLVIAHLSKSEMVMKDSGLVGPMILFLNQYFNEYIPEYVVLWLAFAWVTLDLFHYCSSVCLEMCDYMNIQLFTIPYPSNKKSDDATTSSINRPKTRSMK